MTQKEKNRLDVFIDEVRDWKEGAEKRFLKGDAKMDKILNHLVDDIESSNVGLLTRTNNIEKILYDLKVYIDNEKRKRTIKDRILGGSIVTIIGAIIAYFFKN
jgi:uncharacterized membrane protein YoaK (UPF0700 family)